MKRRILIAVLAFVLFGIGYVAWTLAGLPPVRFILRYGLSPGCEPTGNVKTIEGVEFVEIGPGIFRMGSDHLAEGGDWLGRICEPLGLPWGMRPEPSLEMPVRWIEFPRGFWIAKTEVTYGQFWEFDFRRDPAALDVEAAAVSWEDAKAYCNWLAGEAGLPIRLPSEAEWECACRAGSTGEYCFGEKGKLSDHAWFAGNPRPDLLRNPVARLKPNNWGLFDMHGNRYEWCADSFFRGLAHLPSDGTPIVVEGRPWRVVRGGCDFSEAVRCRSASRFMVTKPGTIHDEYGFRPAFTSPDE